MWFSTRVFVLMIWRRMCMWRSKCPKNPCKATVKPESKALEQFNMRGCADQKDDAVMCSTSTEDNLHFQLLSSSAPPLLNMYTVFVSPLQREEIKRKHWHLSHPSQNGQDVFFLFIKELWLTLVLHETSKLMSSVFFQRPENCSPLLFSQRFC